MHVPGRRHKMDSTGARYQDFAKAVLGSLAAVVEVPREHDFGIDLFCQLLKPAGSATQTTTHLFSVQVKGGQERLCYGGLKSSEWKEYEFTWLKSLATPLYLAVVDEKFRYVNLFSLLPLWWIFWQTAPHPFHVDFKTGNPKRTLARWQKPTYVSARTSQLFGDRRNWTVPLGPPFLRLTLNMMRSEKSQEQARLVLQTWVANDHQNLMRYHQFIPAYNGFQEWATNLVPNKMVMYQFWSSQPGLNIARLSGTAVPLVVNMGIHLQWQNDLAAYILIPLLEWWASLGHLDEIGKGLLDGLRRTRDAGTGPAEGTQSSHTTDG